MSTTIEAVSQPAGPSSEELIQRFDRLPDDYVLLKMELHDILIAASPTHALVSARRALECMIRDVYERRFQEPSDKIELVEMIDQLYKKEQIPLLICHNAGYVRSLGNVGGHPGRAKTGARAQNVSTEEVRSATALLVPIVEWYVKARQSGELDGPAVTRDAKSSPKIRLSVVPKGLHSFDAGDSSFFLKLLPGPFHADDLPESIHFWKERIEREATFTVGMIYGPSGCGKSSLVKAGLLPRLSKTVKQVYVEATADDTEKDLLEGLRRQLPGLPDGLDLQRSIAALRQARVPGSKEKPLLEGKQKVFIVLDQFEQWLHAQRGQKDADLVRALRQCDGDRVQVLVSVRDDFWNAASKFMEELNRPLKDGQNSLRVELFEQDHARQVLAAFGRAYGKLEENLTPEQEAFLAEVIKNLSEGHRVICVRLALFAQMFRGKEWSLKALREVGGTEGVGATFLEETFCSPSGDTQKYGSDKDGAIKILKALLPEEGTEIKGRKRSAAELMEACGYQNRTKQFARLLGNLDSELRLITPTSRDGSGAGLGDDDQAAAATPDRYYQLTHDYLVPSLRKWLTRKLQETRRGRASRLLESRATMWNAGHEARHMPTAREYIVILTLTNRRQWNDIQRRMMLHARNVYLRKFAVLLVALPLIGFAGVQIWSRQHAEDLVATLASAHISEVPAAIDRLAGYRRWADPRLRQIWTTEVAPGLTPEVIARRRLHAALALLPADERTLFYLRERLLNDDDTRAFPTLCTRLSDHREELMEPLWQALEDTSLPSLIRLRAAWALADYTKNVKDTTAARWTKSADFVATQLVARIVDRPGELDGLLTILEPAARHLIAPLSAAFRNGKTPYHTLRAAILARYAKDQPETIAGLLVDARNPDAFKKLFDTLARAGGGAADVLGSLRFSPSSRAAVEAAAMQKANAAVALFMMKRHERLWDLLRRSDDQRVRSYIIHQLSLLGADPRPIVEHLAAMGDSGTTDPGIEQGLILALGEFKIEMPKGDFNRLLPEPNLRPVLERLEASYRGAEDPGVRGAAEWVLRAWGREDRLMQIDASLKQSDSDRSREPSARKWFVNAEGQTMVIIAADRSFKVGSYKDEPADNEGKKEPQRDVKLKSAFAIGAREVTLKEFLRFRPDHLAKLSEPQWLERLKPDGKLEERCPAIDVRWYDAAAYCNWLSRQDGIPEDQWCYEPNPDSKYESGMRIAHDFATRTGYRLPMEVEWEYACRAGTVTSRYYGESDDLLAKYAWFDGNSGRKLRSVGSLKPNSLGLFDMLGNALEWCQDAYHPPHTPAVLPDDSVVKDDPARVMRGEKMMSKPENIRAARREINKHPQTHDFIFGLRVARTYRP